MKFFRLKPGYCIALFAFSFSLGAQTITDKDIDTQIGMLYKNNPVLNEQKVCSNTSDQTVTLKGCVKNPAEKELAEDLAGLVECIDKIDNQIKVNPAIAPQAKNYPVSGHMSDMLVTRLVHAKLLLNPSTRYSHIRVRTYHGIARLSGKVTSLGDKNLAHKIALETKGVVDVINKIRIE